MKAFSKSSEALQSRTVCIEGKTREEKGPSDEDSSWS